MQTVPKKTIIVMLVTFVTTAVMTIAYVFLFNIYWFNSIKVGILHSQTGTMAMSEGPVIDATLLAIEEINNNGGLLGKLIDPIIADGKSDAATFAARAETLILQNKVDVIFGCWTSECRKVVKDIVEKHDHLLFYPVAYEGIEYSSNIVYTGSAPNQQILPAVSWCFYNLGKTFFLVGSDYIYPRVVNELIKQYAPILGAQIVGEAYQPLGSTTFSDIAQEVARVQPHVIINTVNGSSNMAFFKALRNAHITPDKIPTLSFRVAEVELKTLGLQDATDDYVSWNYFQSINTPKNHHFIALFKKKYGSERVISDAMEAAYYGVHLWAQAVTQSKSTRPSIIKNAIKGEGTDAPEGIVFIDPDNNHTWKTVRIGKILKNNQIEQVWSSEKAIRPIPFPLFDNYNWEGLLIRLYRNWNNKWSA